MPDVVAVADRAALLRRQRLGRLVPLPEMVDGIGDEEPVAAAEIVLRLTIALASEQWRGAAADWSFRPVRLAALAGALARARARLRRARRRALAGVKPGAMTVSTVATSGRRS